MNRLPATYLTLISALTLGATASAQSDPQPTPAEQSPEDPEWFDKLLAREADPVEERWLASSDGKFRTRVAAKSVQPPEFIDDSYYVQLAAGSEVPIECWIYPGGHDMAASHQAIAASTFEAIGESLGEIETKGILRVDAGAFNMHPFLALDWLYRVKAAKGPLAGQIKHLSAVARGGASAHCYHNEVGYGGTFERVVQGLVEHLEIAEAEPDPYYQEVTVVRIGDLQSGVARLTMTLDEEGDTKIVETLSLLVPVDQQSLMATDNFSVQFSSPEGRLINQIEIESENGELGTHLSLNPTDDGWQVAGTLQSKDFEASLEDQEVHSTLGQMLFLRGFLPEAKAGAEKTFPQWISQNPSTFTEIKFQVTGTDPEGTAARLDLGPMKLNGVLDPNGSVKSASMSMGPIEMQMERLYVDGSLPAPAP